MNPKVTNDPHRFDFGDPEIQCYRAGVPRANYMPYPFQIFQNADRIQIVYEFKGALRTVYMNPHREAPEESWMGWANGRWEGESLVIENTDFNDHTWFDRAGNYHSDELKVVERYTPIDATHLHPRSDHRRPENLHASVEDELPSLSPHRAECSTR